MKALIVTLQYHYFVPAIKSHVKALSCLDRAGIQYHWHWDATTPQLPPQSQHHAGLNDGHDIVTEKYRQVQNTIFLRGDYDVFIALEDDMVVPESALIRLMEHIDNGADVAYGLYVWRRGSYMWSAYTDVGEERGTSIMRSDRARAIEAFNTGAVLPIAGVGLGCTAIRRSALERIEFSRRGHACNDWYFAVDAQAHGFKQVCDFGLVCGHMTVDPTPCILYPAVNDKMVRKESL